MVSINNPVATGLVASLARPGGNTTGMSTLAEDLTPKLLDLVRELLPAAKSVAALFNRSNPSNPVLVNNLRTAAGTVGMVVLPVELASPAMLEDAFSAISAAHPDVLLLVPDGGTTLDLGDRIAAFALAKKLPSMAIVPEYARFGGLIAYGVPSRYLFAKSAYFVKRIFDGASPAELPNPRRSNWRSTSGSRRRWASQCRHPFLRAPTRWSKSSAMSPGDDMRRRDFIGSIGGAMVAWPRAARTQQSPPVVGLLHQGALPPPPLTAIFRRGLVEAGVVDGQDIRIEQRAADGQYDRLPALAAELVSRQVTVIAADFLPAALAAKAATRTIPIVFLSGSDPIGSGLVSSINRPTGNVTGIAFMFTRLGAKRLELLRELIPDVASIATLINPTNPNSGPQLDDLQTAAHALGLQLISVGASNEREIDSVFSRLAQDQIGALVVSADGFLISRQDQLITLADRHAIPTMYPWRRPYTDAGELIIYGANLPDGFRQCGIYVGKILKGSGPADLPVLQPSTYEFVINLKTAKALGLKVPPTLLAIADEVIE